MTSINDGKDVKSNQASGQKGKTYYIELYKSLDTQLNAECSLHARVTLLCNAWRRVHTLCQHSVPTTHPFLLAWIQRHTARTVLQTEWQSPTSKDEHTRLGEALDSFLQECRDASSNRDGASLPWETQLRARAEWFKGMLDNPWDHPVLKVLLDPKGEGPSTDDILKWLLEERGVVFCARLRQLALSKCDDLALTLLTAVMDRVRSSRPPVNDCDIDEETDQSQSDEPTFLNTLNKEAGFAESWDLLTDMEFVLLHKSHRNTRLIDLAKQTPLGNGYQLVERLINRLETNPKEKKIWKNAKDVATLIAQVMITRCMVIPQCQGPVRTVLYWCSRALVKVLPPAKLGKSTLVLAAPAGTARHLHTLATAVHAQQSAESEELKPFVVELYVRAITFGMNELEKLKLKPEYEEKEARATEQTLASWFIQFGQLLSGSERMRCECMLTAFSVHPSPKLFERIKNAPLLNTVTLDSSPNKDEPGTTENSWANDSRSMTNFVKTSETLNLKQTQNSANVLSTAIVNEGEALGLDAELCTDIIVLLSGPRVKTLSWDMEREALLENCRGYMERTQGGTRALTRELKYLNIDPAEYQHLPEEDENEDDLYYGIEKGYEHLVEFEPQPEEIWEDVEEAENTSTAASSSSEGEIKRKKKSKQAIDSSESDTDPLSLVAEHKRDKGEKKERPHSKERSSSKDAEAKKDGKQRNTKKDKKERKKEKKERKKKEKEKPANSLSHLVGVKVTQVTQEEARGLVTDSDYDSQGKSSLQSEGNDEIHVINDGQFSMDNHKNDNHTQLSKELDAASGHINKTLGHTSKHSGPPSGQKKISSELKKSINRLIQFRKQKAAKPPSDTPSNSTSSLSSLIGTKLQNTSNLILTKAKSDHLATKNEVKGFCKAIFYPPKAKSKPSDKCSRTEPFLPQARHKPPPSQPPVVMSTLPQDPAVLDNAMNQYTQMQGQKPQAQPQKSHLTIYQQFLQELQKNSAAGLPITQEYKPEVKPMSRVPPAILKAKTEPAMATSSSLVQPNTISESAPQCAKPAPPKKVETTPSNVPNTFARLSYMKSKLNEKTKPEPNPTLQSSVSEELDRRIAELRNCKMQSLEKSEKIPPIREQPKVEVQSIEQSYSNTQSLPKEHPILSDMLRTNFGTVIKCATAAKVQAEVQTYANKPKQSSLTEKDQHDISKLLGQKSSMDSYHTQTTISSQGSTVQVLNNTLSQTLAKPVKVIKPPSTANIQQKQAQNNNETIEIRARLPIQVAGTDFQFPVISNTTILRTTAMIQDSKVGHTQPTQPKQAKAKSKRKTTQNLNAIPNPASVLQVSKAVSKKYVPKPPIPIPKQAVDKKEQDWTQVMDALRSQKTVRAPDTFDMSMNKSAHKIPDAKPVPKKTDLDVRVENIIASIMKQQALEQGKKSPNILRQPAAQSTGAVPKATQSKYPVLQNKPAQIKTQILNVPKPVPTYPMDETKRHLQPELIKGDPFISGNQNDDYDILDGLLDDDLRQEIGEILLEEDNCSASNISTTETKHDLSKNKHLMNNNVQSQPQLAINQGLINSAYKAAQVNKQTPAAVPAAPQKEKLRIISNEKVNIRDLADNILPVIRKAPSTIVNKPQDVTISKQTVSNIKTTTVLNPTNVVYSEAPQLSMPNMVIYDPFGVSKSNQNFVTVGNTSQLVYQPYQIIQSALIIPTVATQQAPVNVTFNAVPTTVAVQIPQLAINQRATIPGEITNLPVTIPNQNIIKPANEQPKQDCAVSKTNTVIPETKSCKTQSEGPKVVIEPIGTNKEQVPAQEASSKLKVTQTENVVPSISSDQVTAKESPIRANNSTKEVRLAESLNEKDSVEPDKVTDDRIHKKRQAIINRQVHYHLYYPPIPLSYESQTRENHGLDGEPKSEQSEPTKVKESVQNKDEKEDKAVCRRILLRSSNTISGVVKQKDNPARKTKVRLKDPDRKETQSNEIPVVVTKPASEIMSTESTNAVKDDNSSTVDSQIEEHKDVKTEAKNAPSTGSTQTCAPSRVSKRILNKKDNEKEIAKTKRGKCIEDVLKQNKNIKKLQDNNTIETKFIATAELDALDTLDVEATLPGVKILKTKVHVANSKMADDKMEAPKENIVTECPKSKQAAKKKNKKDKKLLADISIANKNVLVSKEANPNIDTIEILSSPEINSSDENPLEKTTNICNKIEETVHAHVKNAIGNTIAENLAKDPLHVEEANCSFDARSVDDELNHKNETESTHAQRVIVKSPVAIDTTVSDDALRKQCDEDSYQADNEKIATKQVEDSDKTIRRGVLTRDEVISGITPIAQKLSTNRKLTRLVDDIESALSAITETAVSSPVIETLVDKELSASPDTEEGINETPEKSETGLELMEKSKDNETTHSAESVHFDKNLDLKNPDGNNIAELPQSPASSKGKEQDNTKNATLASNSLINKVINRISQEVTSLEHAKTINDENTVLTSKGGKSFETKSSAAEMPMQSAPQEIRKDFINSNEKPQDDQTAKNASVRDEDVQKNLESNECETIALSDDSDVDSPTDKTDKETIDESADPDSFTPKDIPQSYKDSIHIVEVPIPGNTNPFKRCVKIKLPNNRMFKATVHGKISVSFDSLFKEPVLKNILLSDLHDKKKYTLSVNVPPNKNDTEPKTIETVNLISDDEDEPEVPLLQLKTTSGQYKIRHLNDDVFKKHQEMLIKKCSIKLQRCDEKPKPEMKESLVEALLKDLVPSLADKPSEVIEIPDSDSDNESQEIPKIDSLKNMLLQDLGVVDNPQPDTNLENKIPANAILVENKRLSRSRKSVYHRDRKPLTLIIPEKRSTSQTKRSKSVNSNKSHNDGEHRPDYSHIIKRKCYIELERCDNMVKKLKNQVKVHEQICLSDNADQNTCDDKTNRTLSRSGSFSLLNNLEELNVPVTGEIDNFSQMHYDVNPNRTSPVMTAYDMIVALKNKFLTCSTLDPDASKCTSDWFYTKRDMHFDNLEIECGSDIEEDAFDKADIPTDCETDATDFETFEDTESADVSSANTMISLQSIMAKYFENNPIVNMIKPLCDVQDDVSKTPNKRKSAIQHKHICKLTKTSALSDENSEIRMLGEGNFNAVIDATQTQVNVSETDGEFEENLLPTATIQNITPNTSLIEEDSLRIRRDSQDATVLSDGEEVSDIDPITINTAETMDDLPYSPSLVCNMPEIKHCDESGSDKVSSVTIQEKETESIDEPDDLISNEMTYNECNTTLPHESENSITQEHAQTLSSVAMEISEYSNLSVDMDISDIPANIVEVTPEIVESLKRKVLKVINAQYLKNVTLVPETTECATEYETEIKISFRELEDEPKTRHQETDNTAEEEVIAVSENKASLELGEQPSVTGQETPDLPELAEFSPSTIESIDEVMHTPPPSEKSHEIDLEKSPNILDPTNDQPLCVVELSELLITQPDSTCKSSSNAIKESQESSFSEMVCSSADGSELPDVSFEPEHQTDNELNQSDTSTMITHVTPTDSVQSPESYPESETEAVISEIEQCSSGSRIGIDADNANIIDETGLNVGTITERMDINEDEFLEDSVKDQEYVATRMEPGHLKSCIAADLYNPPEDTELKINFEAIDKTVYSDTECNTFLNDSAINEDGSPTEINPCIESVAENNTLDAVVQKTAVNILGIVMEAESIDMERDMLLEEGTECVAVEQLTLLNNHSSLQPQEKIPTYNSIGKNEIDNSPKDIEVEAQDIAKHKEASENILQISSTTAIENQVDGKTVTDGLEDENELGSETLNIRSAQYLEDNFEKTARLDNKLEPNDQTHEESGREENTKLIQFIESEQDHTVIMNQPVENTESTDILIDDTDKEELADNTFKKASSQTTTAIESQPEEITLADNLIKETEAVDTLTKTSTESAEANEEIFHEIPVIALMEKPSEEKQTEIENIDTEPDSAHNIPENYESMPIEKNDLENEAAINQSTIQNQYPTDIEQPLDGNHQDGESPTGDAEVERLIAEDNVKHEDLFIEVDKDFYKKTEIEGDNCLPVNVSPSLEEIIENTNAKFFVETSRAHPSEKQQTCVVKEILDEKPQVGDFPSSVSTAVRSFCTGDINETNHYNEDMEYVKDVSEKLSEIDHTAAENDMSDFIHPVTKSISTDMYDNNNTKSVSSEENLQEVSHNQSPSHKLQEIDPETLECEAEVVNEEISNDNSEILSEMNVQEVEHNQSLSQYECSSQEIDSKISEKTIKNFNDSFEMPSEVHTQEVVHYQSSSLEVIVPGIRVSETEVVNEENAQDVVHIHSPSYQEIVSETLECEAEVVNEEISNDNSEAPSEVNIQEVRHNQPPSHPGSSQEIDTEIDPEILQCETEDDTDEIFDDNSEVPSEVAHNQSPSHQNPSEEIVPSEVIIQEVLQNQSPSSEVIDPEMLECVTEVDTEEKSNEISEMSSEVNTQDFVPIQSPSHQSSSQETVPEALQCEAEVVNEELSNDNSEIPSEVNVQEVEQPQTPSHQEINEAQKFETDYVTEEISNDNSEVSEREENVVHIKSPTHQGPSHQEIDPETVESETELEKNDNSEMPSEVKSQDVVYNKSLSHQEIDADTRESETKIVIEENSNDNSEMLSEVNTQVIVHIQSPSHPNSSQETVPETVEWETKVVTEEISIDNSGIPSDVNVQEVEYNQSPLHQEFDPESRECENDIVTNEVSNDNSKVPCEVEKQEVVQTQSPLHQEIDTDTRECETDPVTEEISNDNFEMSEREVNVEHIISPTHQGPSQEIDLETVESETHLEKDDNSEIPSEVKTQEVVHKKSASHQEIDAETRECETEIVVEENPTDNYEMSNKVDTQDVVSIQSPSHKDAETREYESEVVIEEDPNDNFEISSEVNTQDVKHIQLPSHQYSSQEVDPEIEQCDTEVEKNANSEVPSKVSTQEVVHYKSLLPQEIDAETRECETEIVVEENANDNSEISNEVDTQDVVRIQSPSHQDSSQEIVPETVECDVKVVAEEISNDTSKISERDVNVVHIQSPTRQGPSQAIDPEILECETEFVEEEISRDNPEMSNGVNTQDLVHIQSPSHKDSAQEIVPETVECEAKVVNEEISNDDSKMSEREVTVMHIQSPSHQGSSREVDPDIVQCEVEVDKNDNSEMPSQVNTQELVHNKSLSPQAIDAETRECETEIVEENCNDHLEMSNEVDTQDIVRIQSPSHKEIDSETREYETEVVAEEISNDSSENSSEVNTQEVMHSQSPSHQDSTQEIEVVTEEILNDSSEVQVIELPSPTSSSSGESSNIIAVKAFGEIECDENILEKNATLIYKDDSGVVLKGIEYNDPEIGPCYVFPLVKSSDVSEESELLNENGNSTIEVIQEMNSEVEMQSPERSESKTDLYDDKYLEVQQPKVTYTKRKLKRKSNMKDVTISEKRTRRNPKTAENIQLIIASRFRKAKKIDVPKLTAAAIAKTSYVKEFKELMEHFDNIEFSYSISFCREFIDVPRLLQNWPIEGPVPEDFNNDQEIETLLFVDSQKFEDPLEMSFVEEITADYNDANYPITADETDMNVGFGEGSGRVIQNLDGGAISKFSAATLSDVKQSQPFLLSEKSDDTDMVKFHQSSQQELLETINRLSTYLDLKEKVRSFFKNTTIELSRTSKKEKDSINNEDTSSFPFHLYIPKLVEPRPVQTIVQVVQVGQLPVSAAAQNPVTCDPRVTHVSDASPSQCSVDNSPLEPQHDTRTEYTELTTADLSMPLVEEYTPHNQSLPMDSQEGTNMTVSTENIPIQTELLKSGMKFVEIADENAEDKDKRTENSDQTDRNNSVGDFLYDSCNTRTSVEADMKALFEPDKEDTSEAIPDPKPQNGSVEKTDQIAHAMNAAGISTTPEPVPQLNRAQAFVSLLSQKIRQSAAAASPNSPNSYPKTTTINAISLQQALAQILPPPLNQTSGSDNNQQSQNTGTPQVLHIVQGKGGSGNQITLLDNTQQSVITTPNATPVLHIVQNKTTTPGAASNGSPAPQSNAFGGISLVDAGLQQGGNQLLHIVNTGNQKNNNASQLLKRVNLLTNLTNVQGSNEQKMVQFVCKSADGKSIQLNAPHQRSMVLRLQPIDTPNVQTVTSKPAENQELSPTSNSAVNTASTTNKTDTSNNQEIKSRSVYEENYAKFIQNSSVKPTVLEKLPKFNQAFGKSVYQDGSQKQNEINTNNLSSVNAGTESTDCPPAENTINLDHIGPINSPPLLLRKSPPTTQTTQTNLVQQIKQAIAPMNLQTMHGGVIYTRQIPVNIGGGQTINLITVPSTEMVDESGQKQQINQEGVEPSIIKIVPQSQPQTSTTEGTAVNDENAQQNPTQPQPVLTQMRIKLPMLSKNPQMVSGARVVRPSFFQIQRNIVGGTNQQVYQQLVLTAAPPLGQQTIRLPQTQTRQIKIPDNQSPSESQMSTSTLEQLREFDMVLEQVKERSTGQPNSNSNSSFKLHNNSTDTTDSPPSATSTSTAETTQVLYSIGSNQPINIAYVNRKTTVTTPTTSTFVRSPDSSGIADSPTSSSSQAPLPQPETSAESSSTGSTSQPKVKISSRQRPRPKPHQQNTVKVTPPPKPSAQKPLEDEQTTQRILYILAEYKEQVENSPDKDKPAPRRRNNPPTNPSGSSKRKKSSSGSRRSGRDLSPINGDDMCRTMGSEDSSCGTSQGDCNESCMDSHSPQDSPQKVSRKLSFEPEPSLTPTPKSQPQRNVIVADGQTITVARGTPGKPTTAVLMPANYILPVSMVKGGQQIAIVTNRGPKLLTVGGGEAGATNALLLQRLIGPAGLKPVLARPGVRHVRLPTAALHNLQAFNLATASNTQPPDSTASPASDQNPPDLVDSNRTETSPWADRSGNKPDRASSPDETEPWNLPSSADPHDYSYEETVRAENMERTVLDQIQDRYSPDMEAQRIFDKMFDVEKKSYTVDSVDSPRCAYDIDASDCDDKPYQVVHKKDTTARQGRFAHVSAAALRHKYAILEHELRLQKSLSEECEDLGVDSPSASELFPEAELLFAASPAQDHAAEAPSHHHSHTPQPTHINQSAIQPDIDDQIATDHLLQQRDDSANDRPDLDVNLGLEDVGIVTVSEDGMQASIALDQEEFARSHPNTTFHSEPTEDSEVQPFTLSGLKSRPVTSTIFHANRPSATVLMTAPQATVISQTTTEQTQHNVKYSELDNMIHTLPSTHTNNINLPSVLVKDDGLTRFDNILTDSRELHLSNTASAIVHSSGNATQVIRRVCYDDNKRARDSFLMDEPESIIAGDDAKMVAEDSSRDATLESMAGDVDDDNSSPGRNAELFWESNSASERSESRRPLDFSSDSEKCCKSPSYDETNSTDSSGIGANMRLDSVIKDARGIDRSGSADGSSADDTHPPLRTYPPKRLFHTTEGDVERSLSGKTRAGESSPDTEVRRRASLRGVVKRGCHCCNGSPAPPKPKKPRQRKSTSDFTH